MHEFLVLVKPVVRSTAFCGVGCCDHPRVRLSLSPSSPSCPTRYPHPPRHLSPIQHPIVLQATEEAEFSKHDGCNPFSWEEEKKEEKCRRGLSICAGLIGWCIGSYLSCISHQIALPMHRQSVSKRLMQASVDDPHPDTRNLSL